MAQAPLTPQAATLHRLISAGQKAGVVMVEANAGDETLKSEKGSSAHPVAQQMIEALSKACTELDKTVLVVAEQLDTFNKALEKNFSNRLSQLAQKAATAIGTSVDDLAMKNEDLAERLADLERAEIETIMQTSSEMRQHLSDSAQQATKEITVFIKGEMKKLQDLVDNPQTELVELSRQQVAEVERLTNQNMETIKRQVSEYEKAIVSSFESLDAQAQDVLAAGKQKLSGKLLGYEQEFERKIIEVKDNLSKLTGAAIEELVSKGEAGNGKVVSCSEQAAKKLSNQVDDWQTNLSFVSDEYQTTLSQNKNSFEEMHAKRLAGRVIEAKDEINKIARDAQTKFTISHKLFVASLKRLEKQYYDRLEHLFLQFERALAQEAHLTPFGSAYPLQAGSELKGILRARLQARGMEIVKGFKRQVEQLESEYTRVSAGLHERLETVRATTIDGLEKQAKNMSLEASKVLRSLKNELAIYNLQLPEIDDAGHTAALAVKAYRSARLSFGSD